MLLALVAAAFAVPVLWAVSVGAVRDIRRARRRDPRVGCQAWVAVPGLGARRYRCGQPRYAGGPWCRRHEVDQARGGDLEDADGGASGLTWIDEPQAVGRALVQARIGVPLAVAALLAALVLAGWALTLTG